MNVRLNLVGEMLVLPWHGQGDLRREFEQERLAVRLDGAEGDGSLKSVGGAMVCLHTGTMEVHRACCFINQVGEAATPSAVDRKSIYPIL